MALKYLNPVLIFAGIGSGLIGNYSSSTPSKSKLLPPDFAFGIWAVIYVTGLILAIGLLRGKYSDAKVGSTFISLGFFLSGLWIRFDGHQYLVAFIALATLGANIAGIYYLRKSSISSILLNFLATFAGWITVATSLVWADATHISTDTNGKVAIYLACSVVVAFILYLSLNRVIGYIATVTWALFSLLFTRSTLGSPGYVVALSAFAIALGLLTFKVVSQRATT